MRIIAGQSRGVRLAAPRGMMTRPTADRVKEALFSILESREIVRDARVLDLFAGSGALGLEALSRGAAFALFVEKQREAQDAIRQNIAKTRQSERSELLALDCLQALPIIAARHEPFHLILLDPPYQSGVYAAIISAIANHRLIRPEGLLVAESAARTLLPERVDILIRCDSRNYGDTTLVFYQQEQHNAP